MEKLVRGLHTFQSTLFSSQRALFERLAEGQTPEVLFITCADSRINPNLITQAEPGELYILRNAGNIVPPYGASNGGEGATIEFGVVGLGVKHIIVCGHSHCGAMKGLLAPDSLVKVPQMADWLKYAESTRRIMAENYIELQGTALLTATVEENVLVQLENLRTHPSVAARLAVNKIHLHAWVYKIETGEVFRYDPAQGQYLTLSADLQAALPTRP